MGWLRENWLDALIFLLIALVVAGIVLYLTGVNPLARTPAPAPAGPEAPPPVSSQAPLAPPPSQEEEPVVTVLPMFGPSGQSNPLPQAPAEVPKAKNPVPQTPPPERPAKGAGVWRVAVGSFANPENALRLSEELSSKGFTVRLEAAGSYTRVVVGPYASEEEARKAAQALSRYAPQVYRGEGPPPFAYFQVGAFQKEENALALAARLKGAFPSGKHQGAGISVVIRKDGLYRVLVGPVSEENKEALEGRLEAMGLNPLEVR